jgi:Family of unknown function (DUF5334)
MSTMKIHTPTFLQRKFYILFVLFFAALLGGSKRSHAWSGYDYENRSEIDIGAGNLVREGLTIQFYDVKADDYHTAKINLMESVPGGTRIMLQDLDTKKDRVFIMQD